MATATIAKTLVNENPAMALPENRETLLIKIRELVLLQMF